MKTTLTTSLIAGAVAGAVSATLVAVVLTSSATEPADHPPVFVPAPTAALDSVGDEPWRAELLALEVQVAALEARLAATTRAPATEAAPQPVEAAELQEFVASLNRSADELPPSLVDGVERALESIQEEQAREREIARRIERDERIDQRATRLAEQLGLDAAQTKGVRTAMYTYEDGREAVKRAKGDIDDPKGEMRRLKEDYENALLTTMSPAQFEQYSEREAKQRTKKSLDALKLDVSKSKKQRRKSDS